MVSVSLALAADTPRAHLQSEARAVGRWLLFVCALVLAMVVIGGVTRLTESGLSMVKWEVHRLLPPMSIAAWNAEFAAYKLSPQYLKINDGMSLEAFQNIYFWEYLHRLWGRLIGLAFALPLAFFWLKGKIPQGYKPRLLVLLALGGLQGAIGWWMVASGLVDRPDVSHYRLTVHLLMALLLFAACLWTALDFLSPTRVSTRALRPWTLAFGGLLAVQLILGGFVAGLEAGHVSNTWPLMDGGLVPEGLSRLPSIIPGWFDSAVAVHFLHRVGAYALVFVALTIAVKSVRQSELAVHGLGISIGVLALCQMALGILTIMTGVTIWIAALHQAGAVIVLGTLVMFAHRQFAP
jgi:heme a synthase